MTSPTQNPSNKKLIRHCVVCGKKINIVIHHNKTYKGGHFFGKINLGKSKKAEYWECNNCYSNQSSSTPGV